MMVALFFPFLMIVALLNPPSLSAEQRWLTGQVFHSQVTATPKPVKGAQVSIVTIGNPYTTGEDGGYRIFLPDALQFGQTVRIHVKKTGWEVGKPEGGKV